MNNKNFHSLIHAFCTSEQSILPAKDMDLSKYNLYKIERDALHYNLTLDETILKAKSVYSLQYPNASDSEFIDWFIANFKHTWLTEFCSYEVRDRNDRVHEAYLNILETIYRTQSWMKEEKLCTKVDVMWEERGGNYNLLHQTITLFCDIVLACNQRCEYYISYNLDYRCEEMIGKFFTNTLLRRIYEFTMNDLEPYLNLNSLIVDESDNFIEALKESRDDDFVMASIVPNSKINSGCFL
ncbi:hypothetical protein SAMN05421877_107236 [Sphingobacterium lactis]|uniref:Uncharacterized protein n=1 Tax=Sphingobacterium lactis TaxID=797291 RepID=A0A1H5ZXC6_9SPHI|nr:hypothetical protein SAMN05421877_107236 [Sphingobacterium lactis]